MEWDKGRDIAGARFNLPADQIAAIKATVAWVKPGRFQDDYQTRTTYTPPSKDAQ